MRERYAFAFDILTHPSKDLADIFRNVCQVAGLPPNEAGMTV